MLVQKSERRMPLKLIQLVPSVREVACVQAFAFTTSIRILVSISEAEVLNDQTIENHPPLEDCGVDVSATTVFREAQCGAHPSVHGFSTIMDHLFDKRDKVRVI